MFWPRENWGESKKRKRGEGRGEFFPLPTSHHHYFCARPILARPKKRVRSSPAGNACYAGYYAATPLPVTLLRVLLATGGRYELGNCLYPRAHAIIYTQHKQSQDGSLNYLDFCQSIYFDSFNSPSPPPPSPSSLKYS